MSNAKLENLELQANAELAKIYDWLIANKLSLNTKKSTYIVTTPGNKKPNKINLFINNEVIAETNSVKYLGVLIDNNLTWKTHIQQIKLKIAKSIGVLSRLRHCF